MKNKDKQKASKFVYNKKGKLRTSRNPKNVGVSSRLATDLIANFYDVNLRKYVKSNLLDLGCGKVSQYNAYKNYIDENIFLDRCCDLNTALPIFILSFTFINETLKTRCAQTT